MSTRSLAIFLHKLLAGELAPAGPVSDSATLNQLVERPAPQLQRLLGAQIDHMLVGWPGDGIPRPQGVPSTALWAAAALNNIAWAQTRPDPRLLTVTLRLAQALPAATDADTALAYHSLLGSLAQVNLAEDWLPVARLLIARSPITAAWLPRLDEAFNWDLLLELLHCPSLQLALRDRWLSLLPTGDDVRRTVSAGCATANAELGRLLGTLLEHGNGWQPFVLAFYETDCLIQRQGSREDPSWPLIAGLSAARGSSDPRQRRHAERVLARYRPLVALIGKETLLRPYLYLDGRFLTLIADLLPESRLKLERVKSEIGKLKSES